MRFQVLLLGVWLATGCAAGPAVRSQPQAHPASPPPPVLLVHGLHDTASGLGTMKEHLERAGWPVVRTASLEPNDGSVGVPDMARQVARAAEALRAETGAARIDVVGFSMGALVTRFWLQRLGGRDQVRRFVSISGPHAGTMMAYLQPGEGVKQMRPRSQLLRTLARDPTPFGEVEVYAFWTPLDLIIVPAVSSRLPGSTERTFPVLLHHWMRDDARVIGELIEVLGAPGAPR
jgi:triacylglycerol lipase